MVNDIALPTMMPSVQRLKPENTGESFFIIGDPHPAFLKP
jgi:hypothetical protein